MQVIDKRGVLQHLPQLTPVILELGCGCRKRVNNSIGIDIIDYKCVDLVGDVCDVLREIPVGTVDRIYSHHFLEHVHNLELLLHEVARVMRIGGQLEVVVPHFANPYFYSDPTHRNHFGLYTFSYLAYDPLLKRKVPNYNKAAAFQLCDVDLVFKSSPPFYIRYGIKWLLGKMFNCCRYMQEFYEENLCYVFPCYEIRYVLKRVVVAGGGPF